MEIPDLIKQRLGGEEIESAVNLGDEDLICFTPTRTLLYRAEGILSDESVSVYDHDIERLNVSEGRRKTTFELQYLDSTESFKIASGRAEPVLKRLLAGVLHTSDVTDDGESVVDVFRFSELTLVITEARLIKHIGASVWDEDFAEYPFESVTGLEFEDGSVATQLVLSVDGRPQRIKAPSDQARVVRDTLEKALFAYHDVESLDQLNSAVGVDDEPETDDSSDLSLDDTITPLVSDDPDDSAEHDDPAESDTLLDTSGDESADNEDDESDQFSVTETDTAAESEVGSQRETDSQSETASAESPIDPAEFEEMQTQLSKLTRAVGQQNELLKQQHETIERLIEELRRRENE
ncbi:DUF7115 domain-containing protein [Halovenus marina]|uniref:DUF7115 domain-containing protein n=1 Tax=Halovenus marina TaxID=3396621 RepID=UPI003F556D0B